MRAADMLQNLVEGPPSLAACDDLHAMLAGQSTLQIADPLASELRGRDLPAERLREVGRWLAEYGTRRGAVAAGVLLLGLAGDERDRDLLLLLGSLEDLSLYATVALTRSQIDRDRAVFELARRVDGWGRIHAVEPTFRLAVWPARQLGVPTKHRIRARLRIDPYDVYLWQSLLNNCSTDEIDGLMALAVDLLPLADLAAGPSTDVGLGPSHAPDHILDVIVGHLDAYPGHGWTLVKAALQNRTIRNRNMAIRALQAWPRQRIPDEAGDAIRHALSIEPDPKVKDAMQELLRTWCT